MFVIAIDEVTPVAGKRPRVVRCYTQEFEKLNVLEFVAKINAPAKAPRAARTKKPVAPPVQKT